MVRVRNRRPWEIPQRLATPESAYRSRRSFMRLAGAGGLALGLGCAGETQGRPQETTPPRPRVGADLYPAKRNPGYKLDRQITDADVASSTINYYEFTTDKSAVAAMARDFRTDPWALQVAGLVKKPTTWDVDAILRRFPLEERLYRHRCVEAWAMAVPWTGVPLARFIEACQPLSAARFVRFVSFLRPDEAPGQKTQTWYPWPYFEGLTMAEATNELALLVTGLYGQPLPNEHGAPIRIVVPWKYGYKSAKGIVRVEFTASQPPTFWNTLEPDEYGFESNVNPAVPHPRWSQARERLIGTDRMVDTQLYNGYGAQVAHLYE